MPYLKIATWNVNSLRVRLQHVLDWLFVNQPDILALQEIKVLDTHFPHDAFQGTGYHVYASCQRAYNGVALLCKQEAAQFVKDLPAFEDSQRRLLAATIQDYRIINVYVPNGYQVGSEKYLYKLNWLHAFANFLEAELKMHSNVIVLGDFNIAPADIDVHNPTLLEGKVLCSEAERHAFSVLLSKGLKDSFRELYPFESGFTWWDYRLYAFKRKMGLRIDHILTSFDTLKNVRKCHVDTQPRSLDRPSDHAPLVAEIEIIS